MYFIYLYFLQHCEVLMLGIPFFSLPQPLGLLAWARGSLSFPGPLRRVPLTPSAGRYLGSRRGLPLPGLLRRQCLYLALPLALSSSRPLDPFPRQSAQGGGDRSFQVGSLTGARHLCIIVWCRGTWMYIVYVYVYVGMYINY